MRKMNMLYTLVLCLAIGLSLTVANSPTGTQVSDESNEQSGTQLNSTEYQCVTNEGEPGLCLKEELCDNLIKNETTSCSDGQTLCCPLSESNETDSTPIPSVGCGIRPDNKDLGFIVGGNPASAHSYPWAVAVYLNSRFICGATIISERYVLSAAHCILENSPKNYRLKIGAHKLSNSGQFVEVKSVKMHELYDTEYTLNDIALFELKRPLNFKKIKNIAPVCLPNKDMDKNGVHVGKMSTVIGWGTLKEFGKTSDTLMQVSLPIISNAHCIRSYDSTMITKQQLCAGFQNGEKDSCQGDSGGSLCLLIRDRYYQMGIVSWGKGCALPDFPGVYTRVSEYYDWISKNTNK